MGKIRVKSLGDEEVEQQQQEEARKKAEAKRAAAISEAKRETVEEPKEKAETQSEETREAAPQGEAGSETPKKQKKEKFVKTKKSSHSKSYNAVVMKVDKNKTYSLKDALEILPELTRAKFDETVELHINTIETGVSGNVTLPHGTGKKLRIKIINANEDPKGTDEFVAAVEKGAIDFDILIATPDSMPRLARVAKVLGPKGLMPNPKNGTVTPKPDVIAKQFEGGQINFKTEAKAPIIHAAVGKVSFGSEKLSENIKVFLKAIPSGKTKNVTLKSTMSPGIRISL